MPEATAQEITLFHRIQSDPAWFVRECLGDEPWQKQIEILEAVRDNGRVAVRSGHGIGKSWIAARVALWYLFAFPGSIVMTTAPTDRQVEKVLWAELRKAYHGAKIALGGTCLLKRLDLEDRWFALGFATDDPDALQGIHAEHLLAVVDEASGIDPALWPAIEGLLSSASCRLLMIGNPTEPSGDFAREFKSAATKKLHVSVFDTPNFTRFGVTLDDIRSRTWAEKVNGSRLPIPALVTPAWVADKHQRWGESSPLWDARVVGQFPQQGSDTLISLAWIEAAQARDLPEGDPSELGVDVARFGDDETVIAHRRGPRVRLISVTSKEDTMETTGRVVAATRDQGVSAIKVDDVALGGGVTDRLRELGYPVVPVNVGEGASEPTMSGDPERYANKRAELWWAVRERFRSGAIDIDPEDEELAAQLASLKYKYTSRGQIQIERKEDAKKRGISSPDRADALMYAFAPRSDTYDLDVLIQR